MCKYSYVSFLLFTYIYIYIYVYIYVYLYIYVFISYMVFICGYNFHFMCFLYDCHLVFVFCIFSFRTICLLYHFPLWKILSIAHFTTPSDANFHEQLDFDTQKSTCIIHCTERSKLDQACYRWQSQCYLRFTADGPKTNVDTPWQAQSACHGVVETIYGPGSAKIIPFRAELVSPHILEANLNI